MGHISLTQDEWDELYDLDMAFRTGAKRVSVRNIIGYLLNEFDQNSGYGSSYPIWTRRFGLNAKASKWREMLKLERIFTIAWTSPDDVLVDGKHVAFGNDKPVADKPRLSGIRIKRANKVTEKPAVDETAPITFEKIADDEKAPIAFEKITRTEKPVVSENEKPVVSENEKPVVSENEKKVTEKPARPKISIFDAQVYAGERLDEHTELMITDNVYEGIKHDLAVGNPVDDSLKTKFYLSQLAFLRPVTQKEAEIAYDFIKSHLAGDEDDD